MRDVADPELTKANCESEDHKPCLVMGDMSCPPINEPVAVLAFLGSNGAVRLMPEQREKEGCGGTYWHALNSLAHIDSEVAAALRRVPIQGRLQWTEEFFMKDYPGATFQCEHSSVTCSQLCLDGKSSLGVDDVYLYCALWHAKKELGSGFEAFPKLNAFFNNMQRCEKLVQAIQKAQQEMGAPVTPV